MIVKIIGKLQVYGYTVSNQYLVKLIFTKIHYDGNY